MKQTSYSFQNRHYSSPNCSKCTRITRSTSAVGVSPGQYAKRSSCTTGGRGEDHHDSCLPALVKATTPEWWTSTRHGTTFLFTIIFALTLVGSSTVAAVTCPQQYCSDVSPITYAPINCDSSNVELVALDTFEYNGETLVELLGPSDSSIGSPLVITATHGGSVLLDGVINDRSTDDPQYCPATGCSVLKDTNTIELSLALAQKVITNYCEVPHVVINHLHRRKLDANRGIGEAAQGNQVAEDAWNAFHSFIAQAQEEVKGQYGTVVGATEEILGVKGLLFDVHGYSGYDWDSLDGSKFIQWGYRLSEDSLDPDLYCPLDDRISTVGSTISTFSHARDIEDGFRSNPLECLIRGPNSIASRVNAILPPGDGSGSVTCGMGLPSLDFPSPKAAAQDPSLCEESLETCHYFTGGYVVDVHEKIDWQQIDATNNVLMNTVQAEFPRCLRFGDETIQSDFAHILSIAMYSFMRDLYGPTYTEAPSAEPSLEPSGFPSDRPTNNPSSEPTVSPTGNPTSSIKPSLSPSASHTKSPVRVPTKAPTKAPTAAPISQCTDDPTFEFVRNNGLPGDCTWLSAKDKRINRYRDRGDIKGACQDTFNFCPCVDTPGYSFERPDNQVVRDCPWITGKRIRKRFCFEDYESATGVPSDVGNNCVKACGFCRP